MYIIASRAKRLFDQSNVSSNKSCITTPNSNAKMMTRLTSDFYVDLGLAEWMEHTLLMLEVQGLKPALSENTTS